MNKGTCSRKTDRQRLAPGGLFAVVLISSFQSIEVTQRDCDTHRIGTGEHVGLVVGEHVGEPVIEASFEQQRVFGIQIDLHARSGTDAVVQLVVDLHGHLLDVAGVIDEIVHVLGIGIGEIGLDAVSQHHVDFRTQVEEPFDAPVAEEDVSHDGQLQIGELVAVVIVRFLKILFKRP